MEKKLSVYLLPVGFLIFILTIWEILARIFAIPKYILPTPSAILMFFVQQGHILGVHIWVTLFEILSGFLLGAVGGIILAIAVVYSKFIERAVFPLVIMFQADPKVAFAPILLVWLGYGITSKLAVVFLLTFFPITVSVANGLTAIEPELLDLVHSMRATEWQVFRKIRIPRSLPYMFNGFQVGITSSVIAAIIAEFVGAQKGLGYLILIASNEQNTAKMFASFTILAVVGLILFRLVVIIERVTIPWRFTEK
jgi:NitT/TauT family transport system permease protein